MGVLRFAVALGLCAPLPVIGSAIAAPAGIVIPKPGSAERNAILKAMRSAPEQRFTVKRMRLFASRGRAIAYVEGDNGTIGWFQTILTRSGRNPWRDVWGEGDGGSNSCAAGVRHYRWAAKLIRTFGIETDSLIPEFRKKTQKLAAQARTDPEAQCVGDLDGGPA